MAPRKPSAENQASETASGDTRQRESELPPSPISVAEQLRQSRQMLQLVLDNIPQRIFWKDRGSVYLGSNSNFARDAGFDGPEDLVAKTDFDLAWTREEAEFYRECDRRVMTTNTPEFHIIESQKQADGKEAWLDTNKIPLHDAAGRVVGILGTYEVITERRQAELALKASEEKYRELVENVNEVIFSLDVEGNITYINQTIEQVTGYLPEEVIGSPFHRFLHPDDYQTAAEDFAGTLSGILAPHEFRVLRKDGKVIWMRSSSRPIHEADGTVVGAQGVIAEVTQQHELEEQLRQSQKMEAIGQLAGGVAHDFNNLLTTILGYCDLLSGGLKDEGPVRSGLEEIRKAASRAAVLTQQLLAFGRRQILAPKQLDLNTVIHDLEDILRRLIGEDIEFRSQLAPDLGRVRCDPNQLQQVLVNLVVNARDAMTQGGILMIETGNVDVVRPQRYVDFTLPTGAYATVVVRDTGGGISPGDLAHIFEPFFSTKELRRGAGLGLATVYGIVKQSGGFVRADSSRESGTCITVYFPRIEESAAAPFAREGSLAGVSGSERLLVVEDDPGVRSLMCQILRNRGYEVTEAQHPGEALLLSEQRSDRIDLLVTDVVMPSMSGPELARRLVPKRPEMKVLYVSGYADEAVALRGVPEAEAAFLQKPFNPDAFARKVREVLDRE